VALPNVYTQVYGQIPEFLKKIQEGQAPEKFTQQHLKDIGYSSSNHKSFIPMLKAIGFLSPDGSPTSRYHAYRDHSQSRSILGEAIKDAYADLFLIKSHPKTSDMPLIQGKFKSTHNSSDTASERMAKTFFSLLALADIDHVAATPKSKQAVEESNQEVPIVAIGSPAVMPSVVPPGLHYNIQIHLPATKDVEVFNAIFKSLKEHLIG
jgi:hypothetical protein